jgi:hypothetical protein
MRALVAIGAALRKVGDALNTVHVFNHGLAAIASSVAIIAIDHAVVPHLPHTVIADTLGDATDIIAKNIAMPTLAAGAAAIGAGKPFWVSDARLTRDNGADGGVSPEAEAAIPTAPKAVPQTPSSTSTSAPGGAVPSVIVGRAADKEQNSPMASIDLGTDLAIAGALLGDVSPIVTTIVGDLSTLVAGQPVTIPPTKIQAGKLGSLTLSGTVKWSSKQDVTNPTVITLLGDIITDGTQLLAGMPVTLPEFTDKIGGGYIDLGLTLQKTA